MATKSKSNFTEDWLPVRAIKDGKILTTSGQIVSGVRVEPKNIFILDEGTQNNMLMNLRNFYDTLDFEFWLVVADKPVDIADYVALLHTQYSQERDPRIRKVIEQDIEKAESFITNNIVDTEYYFLIKEKKEDVLQKKIRLMISGLANAGLNSSQLTTEDVKVILNNFLNGGETTEFGMVVS